MFVTLTRAPAYAAWNPTTPLVSIHNAWDIAVWMTLRKQDGPKPQESKQADSKPEVETRTP